MSSSIYSIDEKPFGKIFSTINDIFWGNLEEFNLYFFLDNLCNLMSMKKLFRENKISDNFFSVKKKIKYKINKF